MKTTERVAGIDASVKATGLALPDGRFATIAPPNACKGYRRHDHIRRRILEELDTTGVSLVAFEDYALNVKGKTALIRLAELQGILRTELITRGIAIVTIPPKVLKKYATGNGNAAKGAVFDAARSSIGDDRYLGDAYDGVPANYDEADAYWIRRLTVDILAGLTPALELVTKIGWPKEVDRP